MKSPPITEIIRKTDLYNSYRLNVFGYPNSNGLTDLNPGLLDQRKAFVLS
jgi:hypothetical protein